MEVKQINMCSCKVCGRSFVPRFSFQTAKVGDTINYYCSQRCIIKQRSQNEQQSCASCDTLFVPEYAFQRSMVGGQVKFYCSEKCADSFRDTHKATKQSQKLCESTKRIAVLNQKGGTGKTTTAINVSAALAMRGFKVLLIDMDAQGNVGISLGINGKMGTYNLLIENRSTKSLSVPIRSNLDIITSNESLAAAEIKMATMKSRELLLRRALIDNEGEQEYDYVILDCPPSLSLINQNALVYADEVLVPVSCDFLAMVGVKQVLRTIDRMNNIMHRPVGICGVLPTFFDKRTKLSNEVLRNLQDYFKEKTLPPIRINTKLKEAPSHKQTIFEYAPKSHAAEDYLSVVENLVANNN